ncbi:hypothetical protein [Peribacillus sp. SCS-155]|uniref:hypothetical protein n=1 Tax=Peribacillus sedimenti TaxID=3115297 RepID=UPI003905E4B1
MKLLMVWLALSLFSLNETASVPDEIKKIDLNLSEQEYSVTFFDLSEGEATLILSGDGTAILIDTGTDKSKKELSRWLKLYGVEKIDVLVLTKFNMTIADNVKWAVSDYNIPFVVAGKSLYQNNRGFFDDLNSTSVKIWKTGTQEIFSEKVGFQVIHEDDSQENGLDLIIKVAENRLLYLTSSAKVSAELVEGVAHEHTNMIKADPGSLTVETIEQIDPQTVVLNRNSRKSAGLLEKLHEQWVKVYVLSKQGTITAKFTEKTHEVFPINNHLYQQK